MGDRPATSEPIDDGPGPSRGRPGRGAARPLSDSDDEGPSGAANAMDQGSSGKITTRFKIS